MSLLHILLEFVKKLLSRPTPGQILATDLEQAKKLPKVEKIEDNNVGVTYKDILKPKALERLEALHPEIKPLAMSLIEKAFEKGLVLTITQGVRTFIEQQNLYNQGRDMAGNITDRGKIVTYAKPGDSWHNWARAFDIALVDGNGKLIWDEKSDLNKDNINDWTEAGKIGKDLGLKWGGDFVKFKDLPHFELPDPKNTLTMLKARYKSGEDYLAASRSAKT